MKFGLILALTLSIAIVLADERRIIECQYKILLESALDEHMSTDNGTKSVKVIGRDSTAHQDPIVKSGQWNIGMTCKNSVATKSATLRCPQTETNMHLIIDKNYIISEIHVLLSAKTEAQFKLFDPDSNILEVEAISEKCTFKISSAKLISIFTFLVTLLAF